MSIRFRFPIEQHTKGSETWQEEIALLKMLIMPILQEAEAWDALEQGWLELETPQEHARRVGVRGRALFELVSTMEDLTDQVVQIPELPPEVRPEQPWQMRVGERRRGWDRRRR